MSIFFFLILMMTSNESAVLNVCYAPVEGTDVEYGQGAIERNELEHHPLSDTAWLIRVPKPADAADWQKRLNATVDPHHGVFIVDLPSDEEQTQVDRGEIRFQQ